MSWLKDHRCHKDVAIATVLINLFSLTIPLIMMQVYDRILYNKNVNTLTWLVIGGVVAIFLESSIRYIRDCLSSLMACRYEHQHECHAVESILNSKMTSFEKKSPSEISETLNMISLLKNFYSGQVYQIILDLPFVLLFLSAIYFLGSWLVIYPMVLCGAFVLFILYCKNKFRDTSTDQQEKYDIKYRFISQFLNGIHSVKSMSLEEQTLRKFEHYQFEHTKSSLKHEKWKAFPIHLGSTFSQLAMFGTILLGGSQVVYGEMTIGALTASMMLASRSMVPFQQAVGFWYNRSQAKSAKEKLNELLELPPEKIEGAEEIPEELTGKFQLKKVTLRESEESPCVLEDENLTIKAKSAICIHGKALSGTSRLMYLLMGKISPQSGKVLLDGLEVSSLNHNHLRGKIEYLTDKTPLYRGNIIDNITLFNPQLHSLALHTAHMLGLDKMVAPLHMGYETQIDSKSGSFLPSSLIHRICLTRALLLRPRVILVDKFSANMDKESENLFLDVLNKLRGSCTIVIVSDWPFFHSWCDECYTLDDGKLINDRDEKPEAIPS